MEDNIDISGIARIKLDEFLPNNQLILEGYNIGWIKQTKKVA